MRMSVAVQDCRTHTSLALDVLRIALDVDPDLQIPKFVWTAACALRDGWQGPGDLETLRVWLLAEGHGRLSGGYLRHAWPHNRTEPYLERV